MTPTQLRATLSRLGLSQVRAAQAVGIDPRTIRRYLSGALPVPKWLPLAIRGLNFPTAVLEAPRATEGHSTTSGEEGGR